MNRKTRLGTLALVIFQMGCSGCSQTYQRPPLAVALDPAYTSARTRADQQALRNDWWQDFANPELSRLVELALAQNRDVLQIEAALRAARARTQQAHARLLPEFGINTTGGARRDDNLTGRFRLPDQSQSFYQAGFDASWELDLFGRQRALEAAAEAAAAATARRLDGARLSLAAEVTRVWIEYRGQAELLGWRQQRLAIARTQLQLFEARQRAGLEADLVVREAETGRASIESSLAPITQAAGELRLALAVLCGTTPGGLAELKATARLPKPPALPAAGLPSDLLSRRPDLAAAEDAVDAATAHVGVARAALYPSFLITGVMAAVGEESLSFSLGPGLLYQLAPQIRLPLFNAGRLRQAIKERDSELQQAVLGYEAAVLQAVREVESALNGVAQTEQRLSSLSRALAASQAQQQFATLRSRAGIANAFPELAAEDRQLGLEEERTRVVIERLQQHLALVKSLGGGWQASRNR